MSLSSHAVEQHVAEAAHQGRRAPRRLSAERNSKRAKDVIDRAADADADRIISMKATNQITGWSRGSTYRLVAAGLHPKPVKMGALKIGFVEREIREYVAAKLSGRVAPDQAGA